MFDKFPLFSGLKTNNTRCEVAGIGVRKGVKMALYGMECINLTEDVITVLVIYFSYNKKSWTKEKFLESCCWNSKYF